MKLLKYLPVTVWMIIIFYLSSRTDLPRAQVFYLEFLLKKSGHVISYFILTLLWLKTLGVKNTDKSVLYSLGYAFTDEIHQLFVPGRTGVLTDILFDSLGIFLAVTVNYLAHTWKKSTFPQVQKTPIK